MVEASMRRIYGEDLSAVSGVAAACRALGVLWT